MEPYESTAFKLNRRTYARDCVDAKNKMLYLKRLNQLVNKQSPGISV